mgnify:CR=1 FL=1
MIYTHTCSTSEVRVDDLVGVRVELYKHLEYELPGRLSITCRTIVLREIID